MSDDEKPAAEEDDMARLRRKSERFGSGYAVMSEAFASEGVTKLTRYVGYFIVGMAGLVVLLAIASKF